MIDVKEYLKENLTIKLKINGSSHNLPIKEQERITEAVKIVEDGLKNIGKVIKVAENDN